MSRLLKELQHSISTKLNEPKYAASRQQLTIINEILTNHILPFDKAIELFENGITSRTEDLVTVGDINVELNSKCMEEAQKSFDLLKKTIFELKFLPDEQYYAGGLSRDVIAFLAEIVKAVSQVRIYDLIQQTNKSYQEYHTRNLVFNANDEKYSESAITDICNKIWNIMTSPMPAEVITYYEIYVERLQMLNQNIKMSLAFQSLSKYQSAYGNDSFYQYQEKQLLAINEEFVKRINPPQDSLEDSKYQNVLTLLDNIDRQTMDAINAKSQRNTFFKTQTNYSVTQALLDKSGFNKACELIEEKITQLENHPKAQSAAIRLHNKLLKCKNDFVYSKANKQQFLENCAQALAQSENSELKAHRNLFSRIWNIFKEALGFVVHSTNSIGRVKNVKNTLTEIKNDLTDLDSTPSLKG